MPASPRDIHTFWWQACGKTVNKRLKSLIGKHFSSAQKEQASDPAKNRRRRNGAARLAVPADIHTFWWQACGKGVNKRLKSLKQKDIHFLTGIGQESGIGGRKGKKKGKAGAPEASPVHGSRQTMDGCGRTPRRVTGSAFACREGRIAASNTCAYCRVTTPLSGVGVKLSREIEFGTGLARGEKIACDALASQAKHLQQVQRRQVGY
ncbi:hypothetical protein [Herbaspirillum robiniae]|uniref:Uncharacterized protein n=1 Tax=Herbaspirillum robiniae TaxID=2014887 RepID=A0ABX2LS64_9BURK|nr:hypothetical protein [Herbaspirillum robiniae]NUU00951.1 hypothetical protein [Herbaspirillum robiniae]